MSEERLVGIETRLTSVETGLTSVETRLTSVETRLTSVETGLTSVETRLTSVETKVDDVAAKVDDVAAKVDDLGHQMRVLHEDTIDQIKALAPDFGPVRREFTAADAKLREEIDQRLVPLEALARKHGKSSPN